MGYTYCYNLGINVQKHIFIKNIFLKKESIMAVFEKVREIICEELGKEQEEVTLESSFDDLDADSLDLFQVISEIEDEFDIQIDTEGDLKTVGDLVKYVEAQQG